MARGPYRPPIMARSPYRPPTAEHSPYHEVSSAPSWCRYCYEFCCISNSGQYDRSVYGCLLFSASFNLELATKTLTYSRRNVANNQTALITKYRNVTLRKPRLQPLSRQAISNLESKAHPNSGVLTFQREVMLSHRVAQISLDHVDVEGIEQKNLLHQFSLITDETERLSRCFKNNYLDSSSNTFTKNKMIEKLVSLSSTKDFKELVHNNRILHEQKYSNENLLQASERRKGINEEKDIEAIESNRNTVSIISDSRNGNYDQFSNNENRTGAKAKFLFSKNVRINNQEPSEHMDFKIINSRFSDNNIRMTRTQLDASNNRSINDYLREITETKKSNIAISSDADHKSVILPVQGDISYSRRADYSFEMLSKCINDKTRHLGGLIRFWKSAHRGDVLHSSNEINASNYLEKGILDSNLESIYTTVETECFNASFQRDSVAYDNYELEKRIHFASPISIIEDFCEMLKSKCMDLAAKANKLLCEHPEIVSDEESAKYFIRIDEIRKKMKNLEVDIKDFHKWCVEYYDEIQEVLLKMYYVPGVHSYFEARIVQLKKSLILLETLREFCLKNQMSLKLTHK